jgi:hypothetical protein
MTAETAAGRWQRFRRGPALVFCLDAVYLAVLIGLLLLWHFHQLAFISDPIGGIVPVGVPWFGALGAVLISLYGVFDHNDAWETRWNFWHYGRPFVGAVLSVVAMLIFVGLINATGATPEVHTSGLNDVGYLVLAFVVGFRESTFRQLLARATDILLGPGVPGDTPMTLVASLTDPKLTVAPAATARTSLVLTNPGTASVTVTSVTAAITPAGATVAGLPTDPLVLDPGSTTLTELTVTAPASAGDTAIGLSVLGPFGTRRLQLTLTTSAG